MDKQTAKTIISQLLAKALVAIVKIIKTKVLPRAMERYCKNLQKGVEKLVKKANEIIDKIPTVENVKKRIGLLYVLKLIRETALTLAEALKALVTMIDNNVDFSDIEEPKTAEVAQAIEELDRLANADDGDGCGEDGCEIA